MLNAFRHHRVLRLPDSGQSWIGIECSTPFGIIGCYAERSIWNSARSLKCSTPFGIIGCYALDELRQRGAVIGAQRLSAS